MRWRLVSATACSSLLVAGCGGASTQPLWTHAPLADDVARTGDGCAGHALLAALVAAVNAGAVPPARQEEVLSLANVVGAAPCPGQASAEQREVAAELAAELRLGKPLSPFDALLDVFRAVRP